MKIEKNKIWSYTYILIGTIVSLGLGMFFQSEKSKATEWNGDEVKFWNTEEKKWVSGKVVRIDKTEDGNYLLTGKSEQYITKKQYEKIQEIKDRDIKEKADATGISLQELEKHLVLLETDGSIWSYSPQNPNLNLPFGSFGNSYMYIYH